MKISVVIPLYNSSKTIIGTLNSVRNQTISPMEVIVVNDGSTDNSRDLVEKYIEEYPDFPLTLINKGNRGVSTARNAGMKKAKGDWIALLDSDDEWHKEKICTVSHFLNSDFYLIGHGFTVNNILFDVPLKTSLKCITWKHLLVRNIFVTPSVLLKNNGKYFFDESMKYAEDHDLWLRITKYEKALYIDLPLVKLGRPVLSVGGASSAKWKMRLGEIKMYKKFFTTNYKYFYLYPIFVIFSLLKYLKQLIKG